MPDPKKKKDKKAKEEKALKKVSVTEKFAKVAESRKRKLEGIDEEVIEEPVAAEVEEKAVEEPTVDEPEKKKKKKKRGRLEDIAEPRVETVYFDEAPTKSFADFELDERILKGIGELGWSRPTEVQLSMIDLVLEGRNVMARARTGSGKTAAYVLPVLHRVVQAMSSGQPSTVVGPLAVFVAPSKELATQIHDLITVLLRPLPFLSVLNLTSLAEDEKDVWNNDSPQLVVCTPGKLSTMLHLRPTFLSGARHIVLDEADLLLSFGYEQEMKFIRRNLPDLYQCVLTSATLTDDMTTLKKLFMTGKAVTIKLKEGDLPDSSQLTQYQVSCENDEQRFAILLSLFKLKLVVGKTIIFVNTVDRCYRLALFLQAFRLKSCILNAAMPANSRCHVIAQFNKGDFPIVIASDASNVHVDGWDGDEVETEGKKKKDKKRKMDKESGVARGIDFHQVSNVINFDFPKNLESYIHRVGRTARGFNKGTALSFSIPTEKSLLDGVKEEMTKQMGMDVLTPYEMRIKELDSFVLRAREAMAATTRSVVKEARLAEIRQEALRSAKLNAYFARNPRERDLLEKDKKLQQLSLKSPAIADVPDYIVPKALRGIDYTSDLKKKKKRGTKHRHKSANQKKFENKKANPLHSFSI